MTTPLSNNINDRADDIKRQHISKLSNAELREALYPFGNAAQIVGAERVELYDVVRTLVTTHAEQVATEREARLSYVFHATSREAWREIRRTGELRPGTPLSMYPRDSLVYFSYSPTRALEHGDVLLTVKLSDLRDKRYLGASEWQVGTPHPIPLEKIELVTEQPDMERLISEARFKEFDLIRGKFQVAILSPKLRQEFGEWLYKHEIELQTPTSQGEK